MSWKQMYIDDGTSTTGIISTSQPASVEIVDPFAIHQVDAIGQIEDDLVVACADGNVPILDFNLTSITDGYNFVCVKDSEVVGLIVSIPHRITLTDKESISYATGLTTHLCVHKSSRDQKIAMALIRSVVTKGYDCKIYTGYHYVEQGRSSSSIPINAWYVPLDIDECRKSGYHIPSRINAVHKHQHRVTTFDDFKCLTRRNISIDMTSEWDRLSQGPIEWITILSSKGDPIVVGGFRPFEIVRKQRGVIKAAQLVYIESAADVKVSAIASIFEYIKGEGFSVLHGLAVGPLANSNMHLVTTVTLYLDFYNLSVPKGLNASKVSLLYL